jgi:hypothetical protein
LGDALETTGDPGYAVTCKELAARERPTNRPVV